jgi:hypothetical protein
MGELDLYKNLPSKSKKLKPIAVIDFFSRR